MKNLKSKNTKSVKMSTRKGNTIIVDDLILISTGKAMIDFADENMKNHLYKMMAVISKKVVEARKKGENFDTYKLDEYWD